MKIQWVGQLRFDKKAYSNICCNYLTAAVTLMIAAAVVLYSKVKDRFDDSNTASHIQITLNFVCFNPRYSDMKI